MQSIARDLWSSIESGISLLSITCLSGAMEDVGAEWGMGGGEEGEAGVTAGESGHREGLKRTSDACQRVSRR